MNERTPPREPVPAPEPAPETAKVPEAARGATRRPAVLRAGARWRVALRLAWRTAARAKARTALTVVMIALPVTAVTFLAGAYASSQPTAATSVGWLTGDEAQARLWARPGGANQPLEQDALGAEGHYLDAPDGMPPASATAAAALIPDGDRIVSGRQASVAIAFGDRLVRDAGLYEVDAAEVSGLLGPVEGDARPGVGDIVLRAAVAQRLGAAIGDTVTVLTRTAHVDVRVVGLGDTTSSYSGLLGPFTLPDDEAYQVWWVAGAAPISWHDVTALNAAGFLVNSRAVMLNPPPSAQIYDGRFASSGFGPTDELVGLGYAAVGLGLLEVVLLVGPAFAVGAKRSARSLALIRAAGGRAADLRRVVLAQGIVAGIAAGVVGVILGTGGSVAWYAITSRQESGPVNLVLPVAWPLAAAGLAVLLGLAAAWLPARAAARADVVSVLAGRAVSVPRRAGWTWFGLALSGVGILAALAAAVIASPLLLVAGVTLAVVGILFAAGVLVDLAGRVAGRLRFSGRFALRDAARHRGRTAPAVAAVLATMTVAVAGLIAVASDAAVRDAIWAPIAAEGTGLIAPQVGTPARDLGSDTAAIRAAVLAVAPAADVTPVQHLVATSPDAPWSVWVAADPDAPAPADCGQDPSVSSECTSRDGRATDGFTFGRDGSYGETLVDDGTLVGRLGLPGATEAAGVLAAGTVLVNHADSLWSDGAAHLLVLRTGNDQVGASIDSPARLVPWTSNDYADVLPPTVAHEAIERSDGNLKLITDGAIVTGAVLDSAAIDRIDAGLAAVDIDLRVDVEGDLLGQQPDPRFAAAILIAALVTAVLAVAVTVSLAAADASADLATLGAIGAARRTRRRVSAAQGGAIAVIGAVGGLVAGVPVGYLFAVWRASNSAAAVGWQLALPWLPIAALTVVVPLLGAGVGWLLARPRLPLRARMTQF